MSAIFSKLITMLGKKSAVSASGSFATAMKGMKGLGNSAKSISSSLKTIGGSPVMGAFKYLLSLFQAGTMDAQMNLFKEVMDLLNSPAGKEVFEGILNMLIVVVNSAAGIIEFIGGIGQDDDRKLPPEYTPGSALEIISQADQEFFLENQFILYDEMGNWNVDTPTGYLESYYRGHNYIQPY